MTPSFGKNPIFDPDMVSGSNPLTAIWRRRMLFAAVVVSVWGLAVLALVLIPSSYVATGAVIIVEPERALDTPSAFITQNIGDPADVESQVYIAASPTVLRQVLQVPAALAAMIRECQLSSRFFRSATPDCSRFGPDNPAAVAYLDEHYAITGAGRSRVISLSYSSPDPAIAQLMANTLVDAFLASHRQEIEKSQALAVGSLGEQLGRIDAEIQRRNAEIQAFRNRNDLLNGAIGTMSSERLSGILKQQTDAEASRAKASSVLDAVRRSDLDAASTLPAVLDSRIIADIKQQLAAAEEEAHSAASLLGPRHPRLQVLSSRVEALRASLRQEIIKFAENAQKQVETADGVARALKSELDSAKTGVAKANSAETSIEDLIRNLEADKQQYGTLLLQKQRLESDKLASLGRLRLVSPAEIPRQRFFPKTAPFLAGGLALALVLATIIALLRDHISRPPSDDGELAPDTLPERKQPPAMPVSVRLPVLELPGTDPIRQADAAIGDPQMQVILQTLLTKLFEQRKPIRPQTVALLSAFPREGRTLTALMLANYAADSGHRVLLVEADMHSPDIQAALAEPASRKSPRVQSAFRRPVPIGLRDILEGRADPDTAICRTRNGPDFITAGSGNINPVDLLGGDTLAPVIAWAESYDLILFDSPALDQHMDAGLLARQVDGVMFCFAGENEEFDAARSVTSRLEQLGVHIFAYVAQDPRIGLQAVTPATGTRQRGAMG